MKHARQGYLANLQSINFNHLAGRAAPFFFGGLRALTAS